MKVCTLDVLLVNGSLKSVPFADAHDAMALARTVNSEGVLDGEPVSQGIVRASWEPCPRFRFIVKRDESSEPTSAKKAKRSKQR